jgi:hypothetical protein
VNPGGDLLKRAKRRAKFYDFDEYQWQVDAAQKIDPRIHVAVLLGGEAGLRRGETNAARVVGRRSSARPAHDRAAAWNPADKLGPLTRMLLWAMPAMALIVCALPVCLGSAVS